MRVSFPIACCAGAMIVLAPVLLASLGARIETHQISDAEVDRAVALLAAPIIDRNANGGGSLRRMLQEFNYIEPPELDKQHAEYMAKVSQWLSNSNAVAAARADAYNATRVPELAPNAMTAAQFKERVLQCLTGDKATDWAWFNPFRYRAEKKGFPAKPAELSATERLAVQAYARDWLENNPAAAERFSPRMPSEYGTDVRSQRSYSIALGAFWIVLLALSAAWIGRAAYTREFDAGQFPGWVKEGVGELLRKDPYAWARIFAGLLVIAGAGVLAIVLFKSGVTIGRGLARAVAAVIVVGALLIFSALSLSEGSEAPRVRL